MKAISGVGIMLLGITFTLPTHLLYVPFKAAFWGDGNYIGVTSVSENEMKG